MNLKQADIAPLFGGKTWVSEVLNGKRPLTLKMITLLNRYLGIPLESLIVGNKEVKLAPENQQKLFIQSGDHVVLLELTLSSIVLRVPNTVCLEAFLCYILTWFTPVARKRI